MSPPLLTIVRSLSFGQDRRSDLGSIPAAEWRRLLDLTDRSQLTLPLAIRCRTELPKWVQERLAGNLQNNAIRHERILDAYQEVDRVLSSRDIDFMVLKGFAQWPHYCDDLRQRPQYDLDLYCPPDSIQPALEAIQSLGYEPFGGKARTATDHLPPLIRRTGWRANGDYYNTEMPLTIELHFRFWDEPNERFGVDSGKGFWERRATREIRGLTVPTLNGYDGLSYTAWHLVRHLVRGDVRAYHVYELGHFLQKTADDDLFWQDWRERKASTLVEAIAFRLAVDWFECPVHPAVQELCRALPAPVKRWFDLFAFSPLRALERPNKDELFLHWSLVKGWPARLQIAKQRLLPVRFNPVIVDAHVAAPDWPLRLKRWAFGTWFMARRAFHHLRTLAPVMWNGMRWRRALAK
jgi:Uncharacterised nucleotidyltransferase